MEDIMPYVMSKKRPNFDLTTIQCHSNIVQNWVSTINFLLLWFWLQIIFASFSQDYPPIYGSRRIKDFDSIIWVGDLNYRLNDLDVNEVKEMIAEDNIEAMIESDQLRQQQNQRKAFVGFSEGIIKFIPTYKYDIGKILTSSKSSYIFLIIFVM